MSRTPWNRIFGSRRGRVRRSRQRQLGAGRRGLQPETLEDRRLLAVLLTETFDTDGEGTRYTSSAFNASGDFFERSTSNPAAGHGGAFTFSPPQGGAFWASEDINSPSNPLGTHGIVRLNDLNVLNQTNLQLSVYLAEIGPTGEAPDKIEVQYSFAGGGTNLTAGAYTTIGRFAPDSPDIFTSAAMKLDRNLNGVTFGDAGDNPPALLTSTMTEYTFSIPATGTNLSVQIRIEQDGGNEEIGFDQITITGDPATSDPPVLANVEGAALTYTESDPPIQITNTITVTDPDSTALESATVRITSNLDSSEDVLAASPPVGITASYVAGTGTLTLTGTAPLADYQTALRSVTYDNIDDDDPSPATRTVTFSVSDSSGPGNVQTRDINVAPTIGTGTIPHTESFETNGEGERYESSEFDAGGTTGIFNRVTGQPSQFADPLSNVDGSFYWAAEQTSNPANPLGGVIGYLKLVDLDSASLTNLQVQIALAASNDNDSRWEDNDKIEVQYAFDGDIGSSIDTGNYTTIGRFVGDDPFGGDLIQDADLDGVADVGGVELTTTMQDFIFSIAGGGNLLSIRVLVENDGSEEVAFDNIRVTGLFDANDPPDLANVEGAAVDYTEEDPATLITSTITVADTDDTDLESATIQITSNLDPSEDVLALTSPPAGIIVSPYVPATGLLTLTGTASLADYQTALRGVTYENTDLNDPSGATRTVSFQVNDGTSFSNIATRDIHVIPVIGTGTVPHVESFELVDSTHGEGESYESNEFVASAGIFSRVTGQPPQFVDQILGVDGSFYWAAEQTSNAANPLSPDDKGYLKLQDLVATGFIDLEVTVALAVSNDNNLRWEPNDKIEIQYAFDGDIGSSIDTGAYTTIGRFLGNGPDIFTGGDLVEDADLDGVADMGGAELTTALTDFTYSIPDTGNLLSIRVVVESDGSEEVAFDNIRVNGAGSVVEFSQAAYVIGEDGTAVGMAVTLDRTSNLAAASDVQVNLTEGTATGGGTDYDSTPIVVSFAASEASKTVVVPLTQDSIVEDDETINLQVVSLSPATQIGVQNAAQLTILDDEVGPLAVGDDIIGMQTTSGDLWLAHSQGDAFANIDVLDTWSTTADWRDVQSGDFNGDGRTDFVGRNNNSGSWWITMLDAAGTVETTKWGKWSNAVNWNDVLVGDFNKDQLDDIAGRSSSNGAWWVAISDGTKFTNQRWGAWSNNVIWSDVVVGDFDGNGYDDLAGRASSNGAWWLAVSDGTSFSNQRWGQWSPNVTWLDVQAGDFNNDGRTDVAGRTSSSGNWWVANSSGMDFINEKWGSWSAAISWTNVLVGDFNGNGRADIVGRAPNSGGWYVAESSGSAFSTSKWGSWSSAVVWVDIVLGDFNADGKDELAGRVESKGDWWVALSNGSSFTNQKWGNWPTVAWQYVQAGEFLD